MKNIKYALLTITLMLCCGMLAGCSQNMMQAGTATSPAASETSDAELDDQNSGSVLLLAEKAKSIALNHAGVAASDVTFVKAEKDYDDGRWVYEVEFYSQNTEYDYDIDASTGTILSYDHDAEHYNKPVQEPDAVTSATSDGKPTQAPSLGAAAATDIDAEKAKSIALNHAGVAASDVTFVKAEKDYDDGRWVYEVEFYSQNTEYDYDIDASTGTILSYDHDAE